MLKNTIAMEITFLYPTDRFGSIEKAGVSMITSCEKPTTICMFMEEEATALKFLLTCINSKIMKLKDIIL